MNAPAVTGSEREAAGVALSGPLESGKFPDRLRARVVTPGECPRLHGYDVESDLAQHYDPPELALLALTGELPAGEAARSLRVAMAFLAPVSVAHASAHAAVLSRLCGAPSHSSIGVAAIGLAEQAHREVEAHRRFLAWLSHPNHPLPEAFAAQSQADNAAVARLRSALAAQNVRLPILERGLSRTAALLAVLTHAGLRHPEQLETVLVMARLPAVLAETFAEKPTNFTNYPINLPDFEYEEQS